MSIFDEEVTPTSLEDIGFVSIGRGKWMYIFASQFDLDYDGDLKFVFDEFIYNEKKKVLSTKYSKQKFVISDLQELKLTVETMSKYTPSNCILNSDGLSINLRHIPDF